MSSLEKVRRAQDRILERLALCEKVIGDLYRLYGTCCPEMAEFWGRLEAEENIHAALLDEVRSDLAEGELMRGLGHFNEEQIRKRIDFVRAKIGEAKQSPPSCEQAVGVALSIESSIIDSRFFEFARSNGSRFQQAAVQLLHDTQEHVRMVKEAKLALEQNR